MSKSSIITHRHPLPAVASAAAGGLEIHAESFVIETGQRIELVDLTARVMAFVRRFAIQEGTVTRMNADAHLRAMLLGHTITLQISGGDVVLGQWQRVLMAELDGPRARTMRIQVWGLG